MRFGAGVVRPVATRPAGMIGARERNPRRPRTFRGHGDKTLFAGLDLVVAPGDVVGLVGANGAGKSTLLRLLAGIDRPEDGAVSLVRPMPPSATSRRRSSGRPAKPSVGTWPGAPVSPRRNWR